jgi:uncharacterized Fe-S cluster-containing MiaB family protein
MGTEREDRLFRIIVRAMGCRHEAVDGDICCACGFRVVFEDDYPSPGLYRYVISEDQTDGGALAFIEDYPNG